MSVTVIPPAVSGHHPSISVHHDSAMVIYLAILRFFCTFAVDAIKEKYRQFATHSRVWRNYLSFSIL